MRQTGSWLVLFEASIGSSGLRSLPGCKPDDGSPKGADPKTELQRKGAVPRTSSLKVKSETFCWAFRGLVVWVFVRVLRFRFAPSGRAGFFFFALSLVRSLGAFWPFPGLAGPASFVYPPCRPKYRSFQAFGNTRAPTLVPEVATRYPLYTFVKYMLSFNGVSVVFLVYSPR